MKGIKNEMISQKATKRVKEGKRGVKELREEIGTSGQPGGIGMSLACV